MNTVINALKWRYATKKFDATKKIPTQLWDKLEEALILTPTSYGLQPYKFAVVKNMDIREKLKAASYGQGQVTDASHYVVFLAKEKMDADYIHSYIEKTAKVRGVDAASLSGFEKMMVGDLVQGPRSQDSIGWATRQAYIALGNLMTAAATLEVDACPLEGLNPAVYDEVLNLKGTGYKTVCALALGYRAGDDGYAHAPKVRFDRKDLIIDL